MSSGNSAVEWGYSTFLVLDEGAAVKIASLSLSLFLSFSLTHTM
jgi:hypothetical protein